MAGNRVTDNVGGNLSIETKQERNTYEEKNTSAGVSMNYGVKDRKTSLSGGASQGNTKSNYESAKDQAGIRAGKEGYDITVKDNTHLKGSLIASDATKEKNTLTTGTLTWEDIDNKADYKAGGAGISYISKDDTKELNQKGLPPSMTPTVKGKADSTTKSAVADGTITITDKEHQKQDISDLNRDTQNTLNQLEKIFNKEKVQERQELANEFAKLGAEKIGDIASEKGWDKNDPRRTLLHGLLGGITAKLGGNNVLSGAMAGGGMESLQPLLDNFLKDYPDMREEVASIFGYATGKLFGGDGNVGAATAWSGTKFNWLTHEQTDKYREEMDAATTPEERAAISAKYEEINNRQNDEWLNAQGAGDYWDPFYGTIGRLSVIDHPLTTTGSTFDWKSSVATTIIGEEAGLPWILNEKYGSKGFIRALGKYNVVGVGISGTLDLVGDYRDYSGSQFIKAMLIDSTKTGLGIGIGLWNPYVGFVSSPYLDKLATDIKENHLTKNMSTSEKINNGK